MNIDRLIYLAEWLEGGAKHKTITFDMSSGVSYEIDEDEDYSIESLNKCNTSCCIAGAATQFFNKPKALLEEQIKKEGLGEFLGEPEIDWGIIQNEATELLGLEYKQSCALFRPGKYLKDYNDPAWAARVIRGLIDSGKVDWDKYA